MRDVKQLHPTLQQKVEELKALCTKNGITIGISECLRTAAEQDALYAKGRTTSGSIVTNCKGSTYASMHQWGVAFDVYLMMDVDGDGQTADDSYNNATGLFDKVGKLGQSIGLEWGGSWKSIVDKPHFQLPDWGSTATKLKATYGTPEKFFTTWETAQSVTQSAAVTTTQTTADAAHKVGETVTVSSYYNASTDGVDKAIIKTVSGLTIGKVLDGVNNPYRLEKSGTAIGWCNDGDIRSVTAAATTTATTAVSTTPTASKSNPVAAQSKDAKYKKTYTTKTNLNMRLKPVDGGVILTVKLGESVTCYGYYTHGTDGYDWLFVQYGKYTGYMRADYLN